MAKSCSNVRLKRLHSDIGKLQDTKHHTAREIAQIEPQYSKKGPTLKCMNGEAEIRTVFFHHSVSNPQEESLQETKGASEALLLYIHQVRQLLHCMAWTFHICKGYLISPGSWLVPKAFYHQIFDCSCSCCKSIQSHLCRKSKLLCKSIPAIADYHMLLHPKSSFHYFST